MISYLLLFWLGLCFGSFINALVWRLYKQQQTRSKRERSKYSITKGRSVCVHCGHKLAWHDLLPVVSWLLLRGRCRYCRKKIDDSPLTELVPPLLFIFSYHFWPEVLAGSEWLIFSLWLTILVVLVALCLFDLKWMLLPDKLTYTLAGLAGVLVIVSTVIHSDRTLLVNSLLGMLTISGLFYALFQLSKGKWIGGGDIKLGLGLGLIAGGISEALLVIFLASFIGTVIALPSLVTKKLKLSGKLPFGPFLLAAGIIVYIFGTEILTWYATWFLTV